LTYQGIVFDFNGTLLWDMDLHEKVWHQLSRQYRGKDLTQEEWDHGFVGRTNAEIWPFLLGRKPDRTEADQLSDEKEKTYRDLLVSLPGKAVLVDGAVELFETCLAAGIEIGIGTAAGLSNVQFYIETFELHRWFKPERIVFDDGTMPGKPHPALFSTVISRLGLEPRQCIVVEDGILGIRAARAAGAGKVYGIWSTGSEKEKLEKITLERLIHTYREVGLEDFR
jgi:beta-phosphoglucomutase-like phosphatase (HAD superfamily)